MRKLNLLKSILFLSLLIAIMGMKETTAQNIFTYGHADNVIVGKYHLKMDSTHPQLIANNLFNDSSLATMMGVYSDKQGNLKLYSNGCHIYDGNYQLINSNPHYYCTDSIVNHNNIIIPRPGNPDLLFVFSLTTNPNGIGTKHKDTLFYSIVNISGSQAQILSTQQFTDVALDKGFAATKHANGRDYWLLCKRHSSSEFIAYRLKPGGNVDTVYSKAGIQTNNTGKIFRFSPNGQILADQSANDDTVQLLHFNTQTGVVSDSNIRYVVNFGSGLYVEELAFSSNSRYAYTIHLSYYPRYFQYDLQSPSQQAMLNSKTEIFINNSQNITETISTMHLASNRKIYNPHMDNFFSKKSLYLNAIETPNKPDTNCQFKPDNFLVDSGPVKYPSSRFPQFVSSWLQEPVDISYTHTCLGSDVGGVTHFSFTDSVYKATWHFGDTVTAGPDTSSQLYPSHQYLAPGKYTVWAKALHYGMWDSVSKTITIHQNPQISLGPDTMITPNDTLVLDPGPGYADYKWNFGDTTQTYTVYGSQLNPGVSYHYSVDVTDTNGCSGKAGIDVYCSGVGLEEKAKDQWKVYPNPTEDRITIELPQALHKETHLKLYGPNGALMRQYTWPEQSQTHQISLTGLSEGVYGLELETEDYTLKKKVVKR